MSRTTGHPYSGVQRRERQFSEDAKFTGFYAVWLMPVRSEGVLQAEVHELTREK